MIASVIPTDRQSDSLSNEISAIFSEVPKDRMILRLGKELNADFNLDKIIDEGFDAVFIGLGLPNSVSIRGKNGDIEGLWNAMDFLTVTLRAYGMRWTFFRRPESRTRLTSKAER